MARQVGREGTCQVRPPLPLRGLVKGGEPGGIRPVDSRIEYPELKKTATLADLHQIGKRRGGPGGIRTHDSRIKVTPWGGESLGPYAGTFSSPVGAQNSFAGRSGTGSRPRRVLSDLKALMPRRGRVLTGS